jgi:hypothetical protein
MKYILYLFLAIHCTNCQNKPKSEVNGDRKSVQSIIDSVKNTIQETDKSPESSEWIGNIYRNHKYKFRIVFPIDWTFDNGTTRHTLARAMKVEDDAAISVLVQHISHKIANPDNIFENENEAQIMRGFEILFSQQKMQFEDVEIVRGYLNNFPAFIIKLKHVLLTRDREIIFQTLQIKSHYDSKIYQITLNVPVENYNNYYLNIFDTVVDNFNFEISY